jgi:L-alanine-DL-glutamate epimerase-like enolase superfamily enzyme
MTENRIPQGQLYEELCAEPMIVRDGQLQVPNAPGLGIRVDDDFLRANLAEGEEYWD